MINSKEIQFGVCYYPEHWPKMRWETDLKMMKSSGIQMIRIGEFAWSIFEPEDGHFDFSFFDDFLDLAEQNSIRVIFGTPTATPPAWLTERCPEILNCDRKKVPYVHGGRRHYNYNSPAYRYYAGRITEHLAEHYGQRPCIIGWQIDNEINCELDEFYSEADDRAFRAFLKDKYISLQALNQAWGTVFWNQTYSDWSQVHLPGNVPNQSENPHQILDYKRFISASARDFVYMQSRILRKYIDKHVFITTNGLFDHLDSHQMNKESLDFISYDSYPNFAFEICEDPVKNRTLNDRKWSRHLSETRSISPNFMVMEQQTGANGWTTRMEAVMPRPGQLRLWTIQSIAHGADMISFFRWRTCTFGTEMYWHGILDYDGKANRRLHEIKETIRDIHCIRGLAGSRYAAKAAVIEDYDNLWDAGLDVWHGRLENESSKSIFTAAQRLHIPLDYQYLYDDLTPETLFKYPLLIYPHAVIASQAKAEILKQYVAQGGVLLLGARAGQKDIDGHCVTETMPGVFRRLIDIEVEEFTLVGPWEHIGMEVDGQIIASSVFNEVLKPGPGVKVEGRFTDSYYKDKAGFVSQSLGKGRVYYYGSVFLTDTAMFLLKYLGFDEPYGNLIDMSSECELAVRYHEDEGFYFILNYTERSQEIELRQCMEQAVSHEIQPAGTYVLKPYEAVILKNH